MGTHGEAVTKGPHYETYAAYGVQCCYCALKVTDIGNPEVAFWAYRQFSVDHVVPKKRFPAPAMLECGLRRIIGAERTSRAALVVKTFNLVPACHNCNSLLSAYPNSAPQSKILEAFLRFFSGASLPELDASAGDSLVALEEVKLAMVGVWRDKCNAADLRLSAERGYYKAHYVPPPLGLQSLQQQEHPDLQGFRKEFLDTMEKRWRKLVLPHLAERP
jgi:hypothetical protein